MKFYTKKFDKIYHLWSGCNSKRGPFEKTCSTGQINKNMVSNKPNKIDILIAPKSHNSNTITKKNKKKKTKKRGIWMREKKNRECHLKHRNSTKYQHEPMLRLIFHMTPPYLLVLYFTA